MRACYCSQHTSLGRFEGIRTLPDLHSVITNEHEWNIVVFGLICVSGLDMLREINEKEGLSPETLLKATEVSFDDATALLESPNVSVLVELARTLQYMKPSRRTDQFNFLQSGQMRCMLGTPPLPSPNGHVAAH